MGRSDGTVAQSDGAQLEDLRQQINDLRSFLELHLSRHTELLENLQHGYVALEPPEESGEEGPEGAGATVEDEGRNDERRGSIVEDSIFHLKSKARMQSIKMRANRNAAPEDEKSCFREQVEAFVTSWGFSAFITLLILVNVILLGVEVDLYAAMDVDQQVPAWFDTANAVIVIIFLLETSMKLFALGCHEFWRGADATWNILDFVIVVISVIDMVLQLLLPTGADSNGPDSGSLRLIRATRVVRAVRGLRVLRFFRYITAFRTLALSIISTVGSLFWTLALLLLIFYFFSIILTQLVADNCRYLKIDGDLRGTGPVCQETLPRFFSSVPESMLTLFMAITNGISWDECIRPLRQISYVAVFLLIAYVAIAALAILNVVTGVFCNVAIESAHADKEVATIKQVNSKDKQVDRLRSIFREIDSSCSNEVSFEDVQEAVSSGELASFMESMGISTDDIWTLCILLDSDKNGRLDLEEFVTGCMQLHGPAKSLQLAKMSFENKLTRRAIKQLSEEIRSLNLQRKTRGSLGPLGRENF